ncbi:LacI family DNA-binding transcriptional regulator [Sphingobium boeckii]|uniref:LacI family transcriptional regulator n=1 Tax=Sphingobium boeckii TaxID=1082345 RepID=A0A7W9AGW0_9SPHN|nr:LacI family DNA-binding transcriptional regulator [Sphingobium boeckii]MBB5685348.1 LacI family transcriptional regulator [Sphingobium boeckii]
MKLTTSRRSGAAPTLSDVARAAGVSPMTVSRVINRDGNVRAATQHKVEAAIAALKYAPNTAARSLASGAQTRIALIYGNPSSAYLSEVLVGCLTEASRSDVQLVLERCDTSQDHADIIRRIVEWKVDGVILPPPFCDAGDIVAALLQADMPTAVLATGVPAPGTFALSIDDSAAARAMTDYLIALGHKRIGFIVGHPNQTASAKRLAGYRQAIAAAGLPDDPMLIAAGDFSYRSGLAAADRLLALPERPSAIFASNDDMAAAVIAAAHRLHLDIPAQLTVCGFDDTALATTISPELTTVRQPIAQMAQAAVAMLADFARARRAGRDVRPETRLFDHQVIRRETDAKPTGVSRA